MGKINATLFKMKTKINFSYKNIRLENFIIMVALQNSARSYKNLDLWINVGKQGVSCWSFNITKFKSSKTSFCIDLKRNL